jgi:hypothetical protein
MQEHFHLVEGGAKSDKGCSETHLPCLYYLILLASVVPFVVIFVVFNDKFLSYNNICCTTHRC